MKDFIGTGEGDFELQSADTDNGLFVIEFSPTSQQPSSKDSGLSYV
jgi:hypothetical protein